MAGLLKHCRVTQCCCGYSLETGCKIIAILGLISALFGTLVLVFGYLELENHDHDPDVTYHIDSIVGSPWDEKFETSYRVVNSYRLSDKIDPVMVTIRIGLNIIWCIAHPILLWGTL